MGIYPGKHYTVPISELEINAGSYNVISCFHTRMPQQNSRENKLAHKEKMKKGFALLSCSSTPCKRLTDPNGMPAIHGIWTSS